MMWIFFILLCIGVGIFANKKFNRNIFVWSLSAFLFSPLLTIIVLLILEYLNTTPQSFNKKMTEIYKLYKNGIITQDEYQNKKQLLILSIKNSNPENFLVKITPLIENGILDTDDIENIKRKLYGRAYKNS
jgi:hypothetical protein